jgi:hypothetical protein
MLREFESPHDDESDTRFFARTVLAHRRARSVMSAGCREWLAEIIGESNKLAFLSADGAVSIVSESLGHWDDGVWYSNTSYARTARMASKADTAPWYADQQSWWGLEEEPEPERMTLAEAYAAGYDAACAGKASSHIDADALDDDQWRQFKTGYDDARRMFDKVADAEAWRLKTTR